MNFRAPARRIHLKRSLILVRCRIVENNDVTGAERTCLKTLLAASSARIIWVQPMAMPEQIPVDWTDAFLEGRALWLSAFPGDQPEATRESCQLANRWVEQFCRHAAT